MEENIRYLNYLEHCRVKNNVILLESQHGKTLGGNIAAIAKELAGSSAYKKFRLYLSCQEAQLEERKAFLKKQGMQRVQLTAFGSSQYFKLLATAKYLINDNTFILDFIKRPEQIYLNTWHGTPLKTLGRRIKDDFGMIGNAQRNFLCADYLLCPNELTMQSLTEDYMIENLGNTRLLLCGYPRNTVFLDKEKRSAVRKECGFDGMEIYAYLPTWRGILNQVANEEQNEQLMGYFEELDGSLTEKQRVYVKLHPMNSKGINLSKFKHILPFPKEYETYEFLNATDGLITDYSSILFDYAITGKKILLFTYDKEAYTSSRGFYFPMDELPFPQAGTVRELVHCINEPKTQEDTEFLKKFCPFEHPEVTKALCRRLLFEEESPLIQEKTVKDNGKKNVLLYAGPMATNRTTEQFLSLAADLDTTKYNYTLIYKMEDICYRQKRLLQLPEGMNYMGFYDAYSLPKKQLKQYMDWRRSKKAPTIEQKKVIERLTAYEKQRLFSKCRVDYVLDFSGSRDETLLRLSVFPMTCIQRKQMAKTINRQLTGVPETTTVELENAAQVEKLLSERLK